MVVLVLLALGLPATALAGGPALDAVGDCPGLVDITVTGLTPRGRFSMLYSRYGVGDDRLAEGPCAGTFTDLDGEVVALTGEADASGRFRLSPAVREAACDVVLQAIDLTTCATTDVETFGDPPDDAVVFGPYTWLLGPRGGTCEGVCETIGLSCADITASGWTETCDSNVCNVFFPDLPCSHDGDGPRVSETDIDGLPTPSSMCKAHDHPWGGWTCAWVERDDDVRICPCE